MNLKTGDLLQQKRYRIVKRLGEGGMGAVYRAWDTRLNIPVALKEMIPQPDLDADQLDQLRRQFRQEATVLARLHHPNLVRVTDFFEEKSMGYLVMDYVEGEGLDERIKREGALPEAEVLTWGEELLDAVAYCHSQGILHRDIKPQNVILRPNGHAVLVDFGLVKLWDPDDPRTKTAMRGMGTPEYAPPEQYEVDAGHTDPRSDVYSLGATLYHALTGQAPPTATLRIADPEQFMSPRSVDAKISRKTEQAILTSLELPRTRRWQTAGEMAQALGVAVPEWKPADALKIKETTTGAMARGGTRKMTGGLKNGSQQIRPWAWVLVGMLVVLLTGGGWWLWQNNRAGASLPTPTTEGTVASSTSKDGLSNTSPTPTASATATPTPIRTPTASATPKFTATPKATATSKNSPTPTATPSPRATATFTPAPAIPPEPLAPSSSGEHGNPITFEWSGSLGYNQQYQVVAVHNSGYTLRSDPLTAQQWTVKLPAETFGEWKWRVQVLSGDSEVASSGEKVLWFNPMPGGGGGGETSEPTNPPPPP